MRKHERPANRRILRGQPEYQSGTFHPAVGESDLAIDHRAHARIAAPLSLQLVIGAKELTLHVRDVSAGGVFVYAKEVLAPIGAEVLVRLAITTGIKPMTLPARVVRVEHEAPERGGGVKGMALEFIRVSPEQTPALRDLIARAMRGVGTNSRAFPRVACMLDVRYATASEGVALLRDIGEGGLGMVVDQPLPKDSLVKVELTCDETTTLKMPGQVVSCEPITGGYRAGIRFVGLSVEARKGLLLFLRLLIER